MRAGGKHHCFFHTIFLKGCVAVKPNKNILQKLTEDTRLLSQPFTGVPLVELTGDARILVEHHKGITEYSREKICVRVKYGFVCICGSKLELSCMTDQQLVISGKIDSVTVMRGRE